MVKYFFSKSKCSYMPKSWWYQQVPINFTAHGYILLLIFLNSPCFQYILGNKRLTSLTRNDEKSDFWPWKWGVDLYTSKYGSLKCYLCDFFGVFVEWQFCRWVQTNLTIIILSCTEILLMSLICPSVNSPSFTVLDITTQPWLRRSGGTS